MTSDIATSRTVRPRAVSPNCSADAGLPQAGLAGVLASFDSGLRVKKAASTEETQSVQATRLSQITYRIAAP